MLKRYLGIGLAGKLGPVSLFGGSKIRPQAVTCNFTIDLWGANCFEAVADYGGATGTIYTKRFKDVRNIVNGLTEEIAEASRVYPRIRYFRWLKFPTKEHKKRYLLEPTKLDEGWLGNAVFDPNVPFFRFRVLEEFLNGSWVQINNYCSQDCRIPSDTAKYFFERSFTPFKCNVTIRPFRKARCADYELFDANGTVVWRSEIYFYNCDGAGDLIDAVLAEKADIEKAGLVLSEPSISSNQLVDIYEKAEAKFYFEEEY